MLEARRVAGSAAYKQHTVKQYETVLSFMVSLLICGDRIKEAKTQYLPHQNQVDFVPKPNQTISTALSQQKNGLWFAEMHIVNILNWNSLFERI